jgi:hypothetical protein
MKFSIVFDDNGTILAASVGGEDRAKPAPGPGENSANVDIPDGIDDAELPEAVERLFVSMGARKLAKRPAQHGEKSPVKSELNEEEENV